MYTDPEHFIKTLGGYKAVALRMDVAETTAHSQMKAKKLPAKSFDAYCLLADEVRIERPQKGLFTFTKLPGVDAETSEADAA